MHIIHNLFQFALLTQFTAMMGSQSPQATVSLLRTSVTVPTTAPMALMRILQVFVEVSKDVKFD